MRWQQNNQYCLENKIFRFEILIWISQKKIINFELNLFRLTWNVIPMSANSINFTRFLQELKRRKVIHVMTVYIAAAFGLLELADIISGPLNLPGWTITFIMAFAAIGFPIAFLLSWFFKATSDGIKLRKYVSVAQWEDFYLADLEQDPYKPEAVFHPDDLVPDITGPSDELLKAKQRNGKEKIYRVSSLAVIGIVVLFFLFYSGKSIPFTERDWIVITDFENLTDETIFDNSLNTAFSLSINQSRYLNVITRQRMQETLKRMKNEDRVHIDEETGREIAIREGVKVCIVPGISRVGTQYILTVKIQEAKTGAIFRSEILYAKSQDEIIEKLDQLSKKIRRNLGESRYEISGQSKSLSKVTTSSLNALKQFSLGIENHINLEFEKAIIHYENAIRIDTNFTSAKASLGNLLFERFDREKGREWLDQAILSIGNLTDREKYGILAFYAVNIENDLDKGIEYTKTRMELYPDDPIPHNNLGWYFQNQGHYEKAVEEYKVALRIDPYLMLTYGGVIWVYLENMGQMDSALIWSIKMIKYGPDNPWGYFNLGSSYVGMDEFEKAEIAYLKAMDLNPNFFLNQYRLAHLYKIRGMYDNAIEVLEEILRINPEETSAHYDLGINYNLMGESENARSHFLEFRKIAEQWVNDNSGDPGSYIAYGVVLTRLGEKDAGWEIGKRALELDSTIHFRFAELLAVQDRKSEALDHLEKALENGYRDLVWLKLNPDLQLLHREVRYQDLINEFFMKN